MLISNFMRKNTKRCNKKRINTLMIHLKKEFNSITKNINKTLRTRNYKLLKIFQESRNYIF